jgi:hypothetical protein
MCLLVSTCHNAMQSNALMTNQLFSIHIAHSVKLMINNIDGISHYNQHLLMFNGHESHITFEIVQQVNNGVWICSPY